MSHIASFFLCLFLSCSFLSCPSRDGDRIEFGKDEFIYIVRYVNVNQLSPVQRTELAALEQSLMSRNALKAVLSSSLGSEASGCWLKGFD